ncbi:MAG: hypothetical protein HY724_07490 [Candidatus Rokubacteria bacterium]|nr:hypothetical protein [Candidatus Rokubacteria bacterium]
MDAAAARALHRGLLLSQVLHEPEVATLARPLTIGECEAVPDAARSAMRTPPAPEPTARI